MCSENRTESLKRGFEGTYDFGRRSISSLHQIAPIPQSAKPGTLRNSTCDLQLPASGAGQAEEQIDAEPFGQGISRKARVCSSSICSKCIERREAGAVRLRIGVQNYVDAHSLIGIGLVCRPLREVRSVGISSLDEVGEVGHHGHRNLVIFGCHVYRLSRLPMQY